MLNQINKRAWLRTIFGMGFGAPMGLCANCATPIGLGLKQAGAGIVALVG